MKVTKQGTSETAKVGTEYTALNWNIGYAGLDKDEDFFLDGGKMVLPLDKAHVEENLKNITEIVKNEKANVNFIQEIDEDSKRSYNINQVTKFDEILGLNSILAYNFKVRYVPYPVPPLGKVKSGIYTATSFNVENARRFQMAIAYDKGNSGKKAQMKQLLEFIDYEYKKGNYVLVGADFNQSLKTLTQDEINVVPKELWRAENLDKSMLPAGFNLVYDESKNSARLNNKPYVKDSEGTYGFIIDGYIASENIEVLGVETLNQEYRYSDHNPVKLRYKLK